MGTAASTSTTKVERIRIDKSGNIWKLHSDGTETLSHPPKKKSKEVKQQTRHSTGNLSLMNPSQRQRKNEAVNSLTNRLEVLETEKHLAECEANNLRHELRVEELKNRDLVDELSWYKNQLKLVEPNLVYTEYNLRNTHSANSMPTKHEIDKVFYERFIEKLQTQMKDQNDSMQKRLNFEREMREKMEDVVRIHLGEKALLDAKNSLAYDMLPVSKPYQNTKPFCRSFLFEPERVPTANSKTSEDNLEGTNNEEKAFCLDDEALRNIETEDTRPKTASSLVRQTTNTDKDDTVKPANYKLIKTRSLSKQADMLKTEVDSFLSDDLDGLLNNSSNSLKAVIDHPKRYDLHSAKSRDSGYQEPKS
uniref:Uncharacterized protein n=1 Tax=Panagrellus redivivus TaxID=6233 RepID=A0A7E4W261_PANRE